MRRRRFNAELGLERSDLLQAQPRDQVGECLVLNDDGTSFSGAASRPSRDRGRPALGKRLVARLVVRRVRQIDFREAAASARDHAMQCCADRSVCADRPRVHVALRAIEPRGCRAGLRKAQLEISGLPAALRVSGCLQHQR
jgi:hypothetical protein